MLTQEPESGMCKDEVTYRYSKRNQSPEPNADQQNMSFSEKLYVGHLPFNVSKRELDELFGRYGPLANIELKHGGYAFVQYEHTRDAEDAVKALHNYTFEGRRLTVEFSNKKGAGGNSCLICGLEGHWARECPENKEKGLDVKSGKCFKCGSFGHLARFCRDDKGGNDQGMRGMAPDMPFRGRSPMRRRGGPMRSRSPGYRGGERNRSPDFYRGPPRGYDGGYYRRFSPPPADRFDRPYRDYPPRDYYRQPAYPENPEYRERYAPPARERPVYYDAPREPVQEYRPDPRDQPRDMPRRSPPPQAFEERGPPNGYYDRYPQQGREGGYAKR
ncbi:hypothetical protein HDV06_003499 [Boothiomyces sp. JEL0866]|nr:hypothetical protein HDV06_003468 [Boothiomyces sp. JEL0866]KAJ3325729.1 hypothetical protein HDV06_003499 [Boothiomyces sp. JEL0866]